MTTDVSIEAATDAGSLEKLNELIRLRQQYLKGETTEMAVTATAINIVTSLRSMTPKAPLKASDDMHITVTSVTNGAGWRGGVANRHRVAVQGGHQLRNIHPVNLMYGLKGGGDLYKITLVNDKLTPKKSMNSPFYYVLAPNMTVAKEYARARVVRALKKESGMAKYALGIAQAKVSDRPMNVDAPQGSKQMQMAYNAAQIDKSGGAGNFSISVADTLSYSKSALKGGDSAFVTAIQKAANRTAGIINKLGAHSLEEKIPTPFPEVKGK